MDSERWREVEELYRAALPRDKASRAAYLAEHCQDDPELKREVEALLDSRTANDSPSESMAAFTRANLQLGPYRIEALIGAGGMGEVFRATDTRLQRTVAVKMLRGGSNHPAARERFQREARAA